MADMDEIYPAGPEDSMPTIVEMPVYRHIGGQIFDSLPSVFDDSIMLPDESDLMVDIPTYHKGGVGMPVKGDISNLLNQSAAISLIIPSSSTPGNRSASPFSSQLPIYDSDNILPLESTHFRVSCCRRGSVSPAPEAMESALLSAIAAYLKDHEEEISVSAVRDILNPPTVGSWKCATGQLNDDFSWENDYVSFAVQCYVDASDGNMIVEWQRRRGNVHMFHQKFDHFSAAVSQYMDDVCTGEASENLPVESMTVLPSAEPGRVRSAVNTVSKLFIDAHAEADVNSEYTPSTIRKTLSAGGSIELKSSDELIVSKPSFQRDTSKTGNNISPTGPADMIDMFND